MIKIDDDQLKIANDDDNGTMNNGIRWDDDNRRFELEMVSGDGDGDGDGDEANKQTPPTTTNKYSDCL